MLQTELLVAFLMVETLKFSGGMSLFYRFVQWCKPLKLCMCCGLNFLLVEKFSNQFDFYFPILQIVAINQKQKKI